MIIREIGHECLRRGTWNEFVERMTSLVPFQYKFDQKMKQNGQYPEIYSLRCFDNVKVFNNLNLEGMSSHPKSSNFFVTILKFLGLSL